MCVCVYHWVVGPLGEHLVRRCLRMCPKIVLVVAGAQGSKEEARAIDDEAEKSCVWQRT